MRPVFWFLGVGLLKGSNKAHEVLCEIYKMCYPEKHSTLFYNKASINSMA